VLVCVRNEVCMKKCMFLWGVRENVCFERENMCEREKDCVVCEEERERQTERKRECRLEKLCVCVCAGERVCVRE
jgi:hypothetical protein